MATQSLEVKLRTYISKFAAAFQSEEMSEKKDTEREREREREKHVMESGKRAVCYVFSFFALWMVAK